MRSSARSSASTVRPSAPSSTPRSPTTSAQSTGSRRTRATSTPADYLTFEAWVRENATAIDPASIAHHNAMPCNTRPAKARAEKAAVGWREETNWGYLIDDLLDWRLAYEVVTRQPEISTWSG